MDGVEEGEEGGDVVMVNGCHGIVGLTKPEEDDANRRGGWWGVRGGVDEAVSGEDIRLKLYHECVGDRGAGGVTHGAAVRLGVKHA